jgi:hypothetical protein
MWKYFSVQRLPVSKRASLCLKFPAIQLSFSKMKVGVEHFWNCTDRGNPKFYERNLSHCYLELYRQGKPEVLWAEPVPLLLRPPQTSHRMIRDWNRTSRARGRQLIAWSRQRKVMNANFGYKMFENLRVLLRRTDSLSKALTRCSEIIAVCSQNTLCWHNADLFDVDTCSVYVITSPFNPLTIYIGVVPRRWPLSFAFYIFIQQI